MSEGDIIRLNRMYKCAHQHNSNTVSSPSLNQQTVKFDLIVEDDIDDEANDEVIANDEVNDDLSDDLSDE